MWDYVNAWLSWFSEAFKVAKDVSATIRNSYSNLPIPKKSDYVK